MFNQYFGYFLLKKGLLTTEQLYDAFALERSVRPKVGVLAIDAGLLSAAQVEEVQALQHRMDKKFGEIAIIQGYLTAEQLEDLLTTQKVKRLSLSQAVIDRGYLSLSQLEAALEGYKRESNLSPEQLTALHNGDYDSAVRAFVDFSKAGVEANLLYHYVALIMRNIMRFVGEEPIIDPNAPAVVGWLMTQNMTGASDLYTGLAMDEQVLVEMARRYSGEDISEPDALAKDSIAEFLNENNGLFVVNMSDRHLEYELQPPSVEKKTFAPAAKVFRIPLRLSFGQTDLYVALK